MLWFWISCVILGYCLVGNGVAMETHKRQRGGLDDGEVGIVVMFWPMVVICWLIVWPVTWWIHKDDVKTPRKKFSK